VKGWLLLGRAAGIGAGGVLLVIFLVVTGLIATEAYRLNWNELRDQMHIEGADLPWWGHSYDYNDDMQQAFPAGATLRVQSERGAINITDSTDNQIHISVHKKINADSQGEADNWNKSTRPQITGGGASVTVGAIPRLVELRQHRRRDRVDSAPSGSPSDRSDFTRKCDSVRWYESVDY
jgi:hypothetical protein